MNPGNHHHNPQSPSVMFPPISPSSTGVQMKNSSNNTPSPFTPKAPTYSSSSNHHQQQSPSSAFTARNHHRENNNSNNNTFPSASSSSGGDARIALRRAIREIIADSSRYGPLFQCVANEYQFVSSLGEISSSEPHFFDALINSKNHLLLGGKKNKKSIIRQHQQSSLFDDDDEEDESNNNNNNHNNNNNNNNKQSSNNNTKRRVSRGAFTAMRSSLGNALQFQRSRDIRDEDEDENERGVDDNNNNNDNDEKHHHHHPVGLVTFQSNNIDEDDQENNNNNATLITTSNQQQQQQLSIEQQEQLTTLSRELMTVRRKLAEYQSQKEQFHTTLERTQMDLASKTNALVKLREVITELTDRDRRKTDRIKELETDLDELRRELGVAQDRARDSVQVTSNRTDPHIERRFREMRIEIGQLQKNLAIAEDKIGMLHRENQSIADDRDANELRHADVVQVLEDARAEIRFKDSHITDLTFQNNEKKKWAKLLERFLAETLLYLGRSSFVDVLCLGIDQSLADQHEQNQIRNNNSTKKDDQSNNSNNKERTLSPQQISSLNSSSMLWKSWFLETIDFTSRILRMPHRIFLKTVGEKTFEFWGRKMVDVLSTNLENNNNIDETNNDGNVAKKRNDILRFQTSLWWYKIIESFSSSSSKNASTEMGQSTINNNQNTDEQSKRSNNRISVEPLLAISFAPTVFVPLESFIPAAASLSESGGSTETGGGKYNSSNKTSSSKRNNVVSSMGESTTSGMKKGGGNSSSNMAALSSHPSLCPVLRRPQVTISLSSGSASSNHHQKKEVDEESLNNSSTTNSNNKNSSSPSSSAADSSSSISATLIDADRAVRLIDIVEHKIQVASRVSEYLILHSKNKRKSLLGSSSKTDNNNNNNNSNNADDNSNNNSSKQQKQLQVLFQKIPLHYSPRIFPKYSKTDLQKFAIGFFALRSTHVRAAQSGTFSIHCPTPQDYHVGRNVSIGFCGQYEQLLPFPRHQVPLTVYLNRFLDSYSSSVSSSIYTSSSSSSSATSSNNIHLPGGLVAKVDLSDCMPNHMMMSANSDRGAILGRKIFVATSSSNSTANNNNSHDESNNNNNHGDQGDQHNNTNNNSKKKSGGDSSSAQQTADAHMLQHSPIESSQPILRLYDCLAASATASCCISRNAAANYSNNITNIKDIATSSTSSKNACLHSADVAANMYRALTDHVTAVPEGDSLLKLFYLVSHQLVPEQLSIDIFFNLDMLITMAIEKNTQIAFEAATTSSSEGENNNSNNKSSSSYQTLLQDTGSISLPLLTQILVENGFVFRHSNTPMCVNTTTSTNSPTTTGGDQQQQQQQQRTSTSITDSSSFRRFALTKLEISRLVFALNVDFPNQTTYPIDALSATPPSSASNSTSTANSSLPSKFVLEYIQIILDRFEKDRLAFWERVVEPSLVDISTYYSSVLKKGNNSKLPFEFLPLYHSNSNNSQHSKKKVIPIQKLIDSWRHLHRRDMTELEVEQLALALSRNLHGIDKIPVFFNQQNTSSLINSSPSSSGRKAAAESVAPPASSSNNNNPYLSLINPINSDTESLRQVPPELRVLCTGRQHDIVLLRCLGTKEAKSSSKSRSSKNSNKKTTQDENGNLTSGSLSMNPSSSFNMQTAASLVLSNTTIASNNENDGGDGLLSQNASFSFSAAGSEDYSTSTKNNNNKEILPTSVDVISAHSFLDMFYTTVHAASNLDEETLTRVHEQLLSSSSQPVAVTPPKPASRKSKQFYNLPPFVTLEIFQHHFQTLYSGIFRTSTTFVEDDEEDDENKENDEVQENQQQEENNVIKTAQEDDGEKQINPKDDDRQQQQQQQVRFLDKADIESYSLDQKRNQEAKNTSKKKRGVAGHSKTLSGTGSGGGGEDNNPQVFSSGTAASSPSSAAVNLSEQDDQQQKQRIANNKLKQRVNAVVAALSFAKSSKKSVFQVLIDEVVKNITNPRLHDHDALTVLACDRAAAIWNNAFDKLSEINQNYISHTSNSATSHPDSTGTCNNQQFVNQLHKALSSSNEQQQQQQNHHNNNNIVTAGTPSSQTTTALLSPSSAAASPQSTHMINPVVSPSTTTAVPSSLNPLQREMLHASETIFGFSSAIEEDSEEYKFWKFKKEIMHFFWKQISQPDLEIVEEAGAKVDEMMMMTMKATATTNPSSSANALAGAFGKSIINNTSTHHLLSPGAKSLNINNAASSSASASNLLHRLGNKKLSFVDEQQRAGTISSSVVRYLREMSAVFAPVSSAAYTTIFNAQILANNYFHRNNNNLVSASNNSHNSNMMNQSQQQHPPQRRDTKAAEEFFGNDDEKLINNNSSSEHDESLQNTINGGNAASVFGSFFGSPKGKNLNMMMDEESSTKHLATMNALLGVSLGRQPPPLSMLMQNVNHNNNYIAQNHNTNTDSKAFGSFLESIQNVNNANSSGSSPAAASAMIQQQQLQFIPPTQFLMTLRDRSATAGRDDFSSTTLLQQQQLQALAQFQQNLNKQQQQHQSSSGGSGALSPQWTSVLNSALNPPLSPPTTGTGGRSSSRNQTNNNNKNNSHYQRSTPQTTGPLSYLATPSAEGIHNAAAAQHHNNSNLKNSKVSFVLSKK